jgi:hypothetical protein
MLDFALNNPKITSVVVISLVCSILIITAHAKIANAEKTNQPVPSGWRTTQILSYVTIFIALIIALCTSQGVDCFTPFFLFSYLKF